MIPSLRRSLQLAVVLQCAASLAIIAQPLGAQNVPLSASGGLQVSARVMGALRLEGVSVQPGELASDRAEMSVDLRLRGNVPHKIRVRSAQGHAPAAGVTVEVRGEGGAWMSLGAASAPIVVTRGEAGDISERVWCRVNGPDAARSMALCTLSYEIASEESTVPPSVVVIPAPALGSPALPERGVITVVSQIAAY